MTLVSQLMSHDDFIRLSDEKIDHIWSILEAEMLQSPEVMDLLRSRLEEKVTPSIRKLDRL